MNKLTFKKKLIDASEKVISYSSQFIKQVPSLNYQYRVYPNQSYDGHPLRLDEEVFPDETITEGKHLFFRTPDDVVNYLVRNNKVPEWINVDIDDLNNKITYIGLKCCGRFTANEKLLYHQDEGLAPFHILGPSIPPNWKNRNDKFNFYWRKTIKGRIMAIIAGWRLWYWNKTGKFK